MFFLAPSPLHLIFHLLGTVLCLFSSTLLYINVVAYMFTQAADIYYFENTRFLQPWVFGIWFDSVCNSLGHLHQAPSQLARPTPDPCSKSPGVLMITGFFNDHPLCATKLTKLVSSKKTPTAVVPTGQQPGVFEFDSKANDTK
jgi:hypothetical protein